MGRRVLVVLIAATWAVVGMVTGNVPAQATTSQAERFVLTGLVYVEDGRGLAWLQEPTFTNNQVVIVRPGDSIGPYRLTRILDDQVELEGPGGKVSVPLAGTGGAVRVAAIPGSTESPSHELPPHPALQNPSAIVVQRGDPSRNFPASSLLVGAGANVTAGPVVPQPPQARAVDRGVVPPGTPGATPPQPQPAVALQNPNAIVIPRGDPRREFPAASLFIGAGAQVGTH